MRICFSSFYSVPLGLSCERQKLLSNGIFLSPFHAHDNSVVKNGITNAMCEMLLSFFLSTNAVSWNVKKNGDSAILTCAKDNAWDWAVKISAERGYSERLSPMNYDHLVLAKEKPHFIPIHRVISHEIMRSIHRPWARSSKLPFLKDAIMKPRDKRAIHLWKGCAPFKGEWLMTS